MALETRDPRLHDLVAPDARIDRIAGGLTFTEGPIWRGGALLFSDIPNKRIVRWRRLPRGPRADDLCHGHVQRPHRGPPGPRST
jgi:sugar lactone lactonase YvrE